MKAKLRIMPLGGLGEVGKNMTIVEYGRNLVVIDAIIENISEEKCLKRIVREEIDGVVSLVGAATFDHDLRFLKDLYFRYKKTGKCLPILVSGENFLEKPKQGFVVPVGDWLRCSLKAELESYIDQEFLDKQGIFNCNFVIPMVKNHISKKIDNSYQIWAFYVFQKWYCNTYN